MRRFPVFLSAFAFVAFGALAQDDDEAPPPPPAAAQAEDAKFVAYKAPVIAFTHAEIVDGTGAKPKFDQTLIVENGRIAAIGSAKQIKVPSGAAVIDAHGKTLMPGFVMVHEHLFYTM